jgi:hypothetical protein
VYCGQERGSGRLCVCVCVCAVVRREGVVDCVCMRSSGESQWQPILESVMNPSFSVRARQFVHLAKICFSTP